MTRHAIPSEDKPNTGSLIIAGLSAAVAGDIGRVTQVEVPAAPYPFCRTPDECAGKGYCPKEIACND